MSLRELTGRPPDLDCLHCVLAPIVQNFQDAHPDKDTGEIVVMLLELVGEFMASGAPPHCLDRLILGAQERLAREVRHSYQSYERLGLKP